MAFERKYSEDVREMSVEAVLRRRREEPGNRAIIREVADEFGVGHQSLRQWLARLDDGSYDYGDDQDAESGYESAGRPELLRRIAELEEEVATLEEDNRSLTRVVALFSRGVRDGAGTVSAATP